MLKDVEISKQMLLDLMKLMKNSRVNILRKVTETSIISKLVDFNGRMRENVTFVTKAKTSLVKTLLKHNLSRII